MPTSTGSANTDLVALLGGTGSIESVLAGTGPVVTAVTTTATTVAALPSSPVAGMRGFVTNANTATFGATAAGGGANAVPVVYNGTNWVVG